MIADTETEQAKVDAELEGQLSYYGWRVVLAACLGVMAGFGSLFFVFFLRRLRKAAQHRVWVEPRIDFARLRDRGDDGWAVLSVDWPPHR